MTQSQSHADGSALSSNPLLEKDWGTPFELPPFPRVKNEHFLPAFEFALNAHLDEIEVIASSSDAPTFQSVVEALELAGETLQRVATVFFNLASTCSTDELEAIQRDVSPKLALHMNKVYTNHKLYERIVAIPADQLENDEQKRVLERYLNAFKRSGAALDQASRERLGQISQRLATLGTSFAQNILNDEKTYELVLSSKQDLEGLPAYLVDAAAEAATSRGHDGKFVITLSRSLIEPFLQHSSRRDLREKSYTAWVGRGENEERDNRPIIEETLQLRDEQAQILGFADYAAFKLDDTMAKNTGNVKDLLHRVWQPAKRAALSERERLQDMARSMGDNTEITESDWRYYAEKVRAADFAIDDSLIKPYFSLDSMIEAAFDTANRLFGLKFEPVNGLELYHEDVRAFDVKDAAGRHVGLFLGDYFARSGKRSGAWMTGFRTQQRLKGDIRPIIINVMNFAKGNPTLLSFDDATTLFHEFGHGLHGLLSNVTYPMIAGTAVARDFVELPSQLFEHWLLTRSILEKHARHIETGEPIPTELVDKLIAAQNFNQGFSAVEFISSAMADINLHSNHFGDLRNPDQVEKRLRTEMDVPKEINLRHRLPHFAHVFSGGGYAAGYYSYLWSEVMDADAFAAFEETGDVFDPRTAEKLKRYIYGAGNSQDPEDAYRAFRGALPSVEPLLKKRGFSDLAA